MLCLSHALLWQGIGGAACKGTDSAYVNACHMQGLQGLLAVGAAALIWVLLAIRCRRITHTGAWPKVCSHMCVCCAHVWVID